MDKAEEDEASHTNGSHSNGKADSDGEPSGGRRKSWLMPLLVVAGALGTELVRELSMVGDPNPSTVMSDDEFKELFEKVFEAGSTWIQTQKAKPVFFSSIDAAGHFGPTRNMKGGDKICEHIGQNKLISAYGIKARSRFSQRGPTPRKAMARPLLNVLTPPIMKVLVPRACAKYSVDPLAGWFLRFVNRYKLWYLGWQGAVPVYHNATGAFVAAFATSGATGDQDEGAVDMGLAAAGLRRVGARWLWNAPGEVAENLSQEDGFGGQFVFNRTAPKEKKRKVGGDTPLIGVGGPFTADKPGNLVNWGLVDEIGGALSVMVTLRMDDLNMWSRVFDFSPKPDYDSITVGNGELGFDMYFAIRRGANSTVVTVPDFFKIDEEKTCLFTVNDDGHMKVYADGELVADNPKGQTPKFVPRPHLTVAGHHMYPAQGFRGMIENVKVWDKEVSWDDAAATEPKPLRYAYLDRVPAKPKLKPKPTPKAVPKEEPSKKAAPAKKPPAEGKPSKPAAKQAAGKTGKGRG